MNHNKVKRIYRLIKLIQEIKSTPYQAIYQLLQSMDFSRAQFYRDKNVLSALGFEFTIDRELLPILKKAKTWP